MQTINRPLHKHAYKFALVILWRANRLLTEVQPQEARTLCKKARQQAGRVLAAVGTTDARLDTAMRRYRADLDEFEEVFSY